MKVRVEEKPSKLGWIRNKFMKMKTCMLVCLCLSILTIIIGYILWAIMIPHQDAHLLTSEELHQVQRELAFNYPLGQRMLYIGFIV